MKRVILPIFVLAMLLALVSSASASPPEQDRFSIATSVPPTYDPPEPLPSGLTKFHATAQGDAEGYFNGTFVFEEWGIVDFDPYTGLPSGINRGIVTITDADLGEVIIRFGGRIDYGAVAGRFTVLGGTGDYAGRGRGTYASIEHTGPPGGFTVEFTGRFHTHPK